MIGSPVGHSLSPVMHNAALRAMDLDWVYLAFEVAPGGAGSALEAVRALGIEGLSVTMPHKTDAVFAVDECSPTAAALGAISVVMRTGPRAETLRGDNLDGAGLLDALRLDESFEPAGRRCVVLGAGGAARAAIRALADAGASEVIVVNRTPARAAAAAALAGPGGRTGDEAEVDGAELIVNATPVGMQSTAAADDSPLEGRRLGS
ncbi:MAG: shikimate dehydrogenase family protein, partial [Acidimicrobiales bacterium]